MININKEFYGKLPDGKIKINQNKNPVRMDLFISFLTITVIKSEDHLGINTGWTQYYNHDSKLIISGGVVGNTEYLDSIQFGKNLSNPYNNYVNPFFVFEIFTIKGKIFFYEYYKNDILELLESHLKKIDDLENKLDSQKNIYKKILMECYKCNNLYSVERDKK